MGGLVASGQTNTRVAAVSAESPHLQPPRLPSSNLRHVRRNGPALPRRQPPLALTAACRQRRFSTKSAQSRYPLFRLLADPHLDFSLLLNVGPSVGPNRRSPMKSEEQQRFTDAGWWLPVTPDHSNLTPDHPRNGSRLIFEHSGHGPSARAADCATPVDPRASTTASISAPATTRRWTRSARRAATRVELDDGLEQW
jgi:hypothetical protein